MCIIIDANRLGSFVSNPTHGDNAPVRRWLERRRGMIVYSTGGSFAEEIKGKARAALASYARQGMAQLIPHALLTEEEATLNSHPDRTSDDPHVLALARCADVRLLYTKDRALIADFKNKNIVDKPRGRVYSGAANADLLARSGCPPSQRRALRAGGS